LLIFDLTRSLRPDVPRLSEDIRHSFSRSYRTILPNSLGWILPNTFAFCRSKNGKTEVVTPLFESQQGHLCRFWVRISGFLLLYIFTGSKNCPKPTYVGPFAHSPGSPHYETPPNSVLSRNDGCGRTILKRLYRILRKPESTGILTGFPFSLLRLGSRLGSAYSRQKNFSEKPLSVRWSGFSPDFCCYSWQDSHS